MAKTATLETAFCSGHDDRATARILRRGGELRFVTDIAHYAAWTLQRFMRSAEFEWTAQCADDWRTAWPNFTRTRYHAKAAREDRASCFFIFRRLERGRARRLIGRALPARSV